jgi:hypothetical protein
MRASAGFLVAWRGELLAILHEFQENFAFGLVEYALRNSSDFLSAVVKFGEGTFIPHGA